MCACVCVCARECEREGVHVSSHITSQFAATLIKKVTMQTNLDVEQTKRLLATASFVRGHQTTLAVAARKRHRTLSIFSSFLEQIGLFLSTSCMCRHCRMMHSPCTCVII